MGAIVRANVLTRFNAILGCLLVVILVVGPIQDALFGIVLVTNAAVGVLQEVRAKRALDRLALLHAPTATVSRSGAVQQVGREEVVLGDLLCLAPGDELVADAVVVESVDLAIDESMLTGESAPVSKVPGDHLMSGTFVTAGSARATVTAVGERCAAQAMAREARAFELVRSELRDGTDLILRVLTWVVLPTAALLVASQLLANDSLSEAARTSVAGVGSMVPEGLVLLTSIAFAVGAVRLARQQVLVQELGAIEGLARVDVLCIDKTGTLTDRHLTVTEIRALADVDPAPALGALAAAEPAPNTTLRAVAEAATDPGWTVVDRVPFDPDRKWSGIDAGPHGRWVLGAPEVLLDPDRTDVRSTVDGLAATGCRVVLLARAPRREGGDRGWSVGCEPVALVVVEERIRPTAAATIAWLAEEDVSVRVLSGDHPATVGAVAARVGIDVRGGPIDARHLGADADELVGWSDARTVFGRVTPVQKQAMVEALQRRGHVVAMIGDGVNDVLALKRADLGIAMGSGSDSTRAVGRLVLLDDDFGRLPAVMAEGRRVIGNVERVANLFLTKTVYATLLAVAVGVARLPFPFYPRHLTVVSSLTIGIPAFVLALAPAAERHRAGFVRRVLRFAVPAGTLTAVVTFSAYAMARTRPGGEGGTARTAATVALFVIATWVLGVVARPYTVWRRLLVVAMVGTFVALLATPASRDLLAVALPPAATIAVAVGLALVGCAGVEASWRMLGGGPGSAPPDVLTRDRRTFGTRRGSTAG